MRKEVQPMVGMRRITKKQAVSLYTKAVYWWMNSGIVLTHLPLEEFNRLVRESTIVRKGYGSEPLFTTALGTKVCIKKQGVA